MKSSVFLVLFSSVVVTANNLNPRTNVIPNRFIIEVDHTSDLNRRDGDPHPLDTVYQHLSSRDVDLKVTKEYKMDGIFHGAALTVKNEEDLAVIQNAPGVKSVYPITIFTIPKLARRVISDLDAATLPDVLPSRILGGVDKVHAEGNTGKGIKIGIIDTGIDYNHPVLGSKGIGPGKKIVAGYDFVGNDFEPTNPDKTPEPDLDPMDCNGHGTHVAGIIAAEPGNPFNISGVAYGVTLGAYKIFGCGAQTTDDVIIEALARAIDDGMDILTLSLGSDVGWSSSATSIVAGRIAQNGKIVTAAAGNGGAAGSWYASSPASGRGVISVGSVGDTVIPAYNASVDGVNYPAITYLTDFPLKINGSLPIYATSTNISIADDACSPLAEDTQDLGKYLVVIRRGSCPLLTKLRNVEAKGAKAMLIYNDRAGLLAITTKNYTAAGIRAADGEFLVEQFTAGVPITISFPRFDGLTYLPNDNGGFMSEFSSYGPSFDFEFQPSFAAPGENIVSTYPVALGSFAVFSGTSAATPFAAGSAALLLAAKINDSSVVKGAKWAKSLFQTTSTKLPVSKNDTAFETLSRAGAGLINVYKAINSTTIVSPGELILNGSANFRGNQTIVIKNIGDTAKNYTLQHIPALTALTMQEDSIRPSIGPVPLDSTSATVQIEPANFTVEAGSSQEVAINVTLPTTLDPRRYPLYSGFVEVTSGSESYHVSYIGLGASLKDHQIFDNTSTHDTHPLPLLLHQNGSVLDRPTNFTFVGDDVPSVVYRLAMGSPSFQVALVKPSADGEIIYKYYDTVGPRDAENVEVNTTIMKLFITGAEVPNGNYHLRLRALKINGDPSSEGDYESWESPTIGIQNKTLVV